MLEHHKRFYLYKGSSDQPVAIFIGGEGLSIIESFALLSPDSIDVSCWKKGVGNMLSYELCSKKRGSKKEIEKTEDSFPEELEFFAEDTL